MKCPSKKNRGWQGEEKTENTEQESDTKKRLSRQQRLARRREQEREIQDPLFEQHVVRCKMSSFHSKLMSLEFHRCTTCLECFPDLTMAASSTECRRCTQDKHIPKLYSTANNMNPGVVPRQLPIGAADFLGQHCNQITVGNYFKHLLIYEDARFARHPCFRFFALNTEMRWQALQAGRIYNHQHPGDAQLTVDELHDMVRREGEAFSNRVLHYAASLRGTRQYWFRQYWFRQWSRFISMVDTLGLPTIP